MLFLLFINMISLLKVYCQYINMMVHATCFNPVNVPLLQAFISMRRITNMLLQEEVNPDAIQQDPNMGKT